MQNLRPSVLSLVFVCACASAGAPGPETVVATSTTSLTGIGGGASPGMNIGVNNSYTAIATTVKVSPDSAFQVLTRVYAQLQIPVSPVNTKRAIGNDELKIRRRIAGMPMQNVVDCGEKMGLPNAETWDIHMNLLSYVQPGTDGGAQVFTRIQALGNPADGSNRDLSNCATKGELEKKIGDMVVKLLNSK